MSGNSPMNLEFERSVLGSIMVFDGSISKCLDVDLTPDAFYLPEHQELYSTMLEMNRRKMNLGPVAVISFLKDANKLGAAGGENYLYQMVDHAVSDAFMSQYIEDIQNKAQRRQLLKAVDEIQNMGDDIEQDVFLDTVESMVTGVTRNRRGADFESVETVTSRVLEEVARLRTQKGITGIKTDLHDLDELTNGFHPGELIILAARPGMGKSALALNLLNQVAKNNPGCVALFSLEMPSDSIMKRMLSSESMVPGSKLQNGQVTDKQMNNLMRAANKMNERLIFVDDTSSITPNQIHSKCKKLRSEHGEISLVVVDYLQLITTGTQNSSASRQQEVSEISRSMKLLAKDMNCPVIALSQLSRKVEDRSDHQPQLADLRESGSIEQDADIVMFIYREDYYKNDEDIPDVEVVHLTLAKHRNGKLGTVKVVFDKPVSKFTTLAKQEPQAG